MRSTSIEVYFSYADADEKLRKRLEAHLSVLKQQSLIAGWHRRNISAGLERMSIINAHLDTAQIILLLVSPDFMASTYVSSVEMKRAMERHSAKEARVIPILLRAVDYRGAFFETLEALPANGTPVTSWSNLDEAFFDIAQGIRQVIEELNVKADFVDVSAGHAVQKTTVKTPGELPEKALPTDTSPDSFDVFLSYSQQDAEWVENLAHCLEDEAGFRVWLDKWVLVPGTSWQQERSAGIERAGCCAVCIGEHTPVGWFKREVEKALNRQVKVPAFRVIPLLLPDAMDVNINDFLELNTWIDFRRSDQAYAFHALVCGVKGIAPGKWPAR